MNVSRMLIMALFIGITAGGASCTTQGTDSDSAKRDVDTVLDDAKAAGSTAVEATERAGGKAAEAGKDTAHMVADKTREEAGDIAETSKEVASATGAAVSDGWVTAKLKAKFADETLLKGSDIDVDTTDRIVTLKGSVRSTAARTKAAEIASGTEGVKSVVNQLVVRSK